MRALIIGVVALSLALLPASAHAAIDPGLDNNGLQWNAKGKPPTLTLYPIVGVSVEGLASINQAAAGWNATGYVRFLVAPLTEEAAFTYCDRCVALRQDLGNTYTSVSYDRSTINAASVRGNFDPIANGIYMALHELGHVLGLGHPEDLRIDSIMGSVTSLCGPHSADIEAVAARYARSKRPYEAPALFTYSRTAAC